MKIRKTLLVILLMALCLTSVFAMDLSLEQAVNLALKNNLQIKNAGVDYNMLDDAYKYSWNSLMPTVNGTVNFARSNENTSAMTMAAIYGILGKTYNAPDPDVTMVMGISGSWSFNPAMITNIQIAKENLNNGQITYDKACEEVKKNVMKLYFGLVIQQESLKIQEATLESQKNRYLQAKVDYENGYVPEISLLQSQVTYQNSIPTVDKARTSLESSKRQFAFLIGIDSGININLTDSIEIELGEVNPGKALASIADRYDIRALESQAKLLGMQKAALIESVYIPSVVLSASWQPYWSNIEKSSTIDSGSISATVAWNLTDMLPTSSKYKSLLDIKNGQIKIENSKKMLEESAKIEIQNLLDTMSQAKTSIDSSESTIKLAQASYDMRFESYRVGTSDYLDLCDAENQLNQAKLGKLSSQYNYISALIDLEFATGQKIFKEF